MTSTLTRLLFRPGWRLRCIDPPIAWVRITDDRPATAAIRLQLTSYLTSRWANDVKVKDTQLVVRVDDRSFVVPSLQATDEAGTPFPTDGYSVGGKSPHHAIVDYETDAPDLVAALRETDMPLPITVEACMNLGSSFRGIATLDLERTSSSVIESGWHRVGTGRELDR